MPIIQSAKKRVRSSLRKRKSNDIKRRKNHEIFKEISGFVKDKKKKEAGDLLPKYFSSLDKLAKKNIIHKNKAAREKSRINKLVNKL